LTVVVISASTGLTVEAFGGGRRDRPQLDPGQAGRVLQGVEEAWQGRRGRELGPGQAGLGLELGLVGLERLQRLDLVAQRLALGDGGPPVGLRLGRGLAGRPDQQQGRGEHHQQGPDGGEDQLPTAGHGVTVPAGWNRPE
jgi:hypothetical protein